MMVALLIAALVLGLLLALRALWKQNRALAELESAARRGQPLLHEDSPAGYLPAWGGATAEVNQLIATNNSLRQQRTDQLAQLEATLGHLREAVLIVDQANYIHLANRALREIFPAARDLVNLRLELIIRSAAFLEYVRVTREGAPLARQEFEIVDGENTRWIEASGAPITSPDGKSPWALFVIHDMTSQRKLERMRRDFVANASHELRTPLSIIKGYVETLVDGHQTMEVADRDKFLKTIQRHSDRLKSIIDDLLALSRLESATPGLKFASLELGAYLQELAGEFRRQPQAAEHEIAAVVAENSGMLAADEEKLTQVFGNLVENALKYTPKGSRIELGAAAIGDDEVECFVRDNGHGIPAADLPHIFERFYRVEKGRSRETGGTGLGLSIAKHIVQLHGGRMWAENREGGGLVIFVRLPRRRRTERP
ncbi:MAG TPA: ATP-binding protein [Lacunisphaera sp.]|nr:ATP-binding protein [Lacunisphaera sp.]